jgi:hypothetical protein
VTLRVLDATHPSVQHDEPSMSKGPGDAVEMTILLCGGGRSGHGPLEVDGGGIRLTEVFESVSQKPSTADIPAG